VIEAHVAPQSIDHIRAGQPAFVRFPGGTASVVRTPARHQIGSSASVLFNQSTTTQIIVTV
jgi:hypothetical protein